MIVRVSQLQESVGLIQSFWSDQRSDQKFCLWRFWTKNLENFVNFVYHSASLVSLNFPPADLFHIRSCGASPFWLIPAVCSETLTSSCHKTSWTWHRVVDVPPDLKPSRLKDWRSFSLLLMTFSWNKEKLLSSAALIFMLNWSFIIVEPEERHQWMCGF